MDGKPQDMRVWWWPLNLEEVDRELARHALLCHVRILDPGVMDRVLQGDASVCGADNPIAFAKLRNLLMMHFLIRQRSAEAVGQLETARVESEIVASLKIRFAILR